jgi:hypothetical protein
VRGSGFFEKAPLSFGYSRFVAPNVGHFYKTNRPCEAFVEEQYSYFYLSRHMSGRSLHRLYCLDFLFFLDFHTTMILLLSKKGSMPADALAYLKPDFGKLEEEFANDRLRA